MSDQDQIREEFLTSKISRRDAVKQLLGLGLSAPAAYGFLGVISASASKDVFAQRTLSQGEVTRQAEALARFAASDAALGPIRDLDRRPYSAYDDPQTRAAKAIEEIYTRDNINKLASQMGIPTRDLRLTTRIFEREKGQTLFVGTVYDYDDFRGNFKLYSRQPVQLSANSRAQVTDRPPSPTNLTICASVGYIVCVTVGT